MPCSTSRANLSVFNSLRVILDTKTSGCNGSSILARAATRRRRRFRRTQMASAQAHLERRARVNLGNTPPLGQPRGNFGAAAFGGIAATGDPGGFELAV